MARKWRSLDVLANEQKKINEELRAYHQELITRAKATGNVAGECAAEVVEEMQKCEFASEEYKAFMTRYNGMMKLATM